MNLTNGEYLLIVSGLLSFLTFVGLFSLKRHRESFLYQKLKLNKHKIYRLSRLCLTIFTFCLTLLSGSQFFQIVEPYSVASLIWSFLGITSLQILWWNLTYNHKKDSVSLISSSQSKKTKLAQTQETHKKDKNSVYVQTVVNKEIIELIEKEIKKNLAEQKFNEEKAE